MSLGPALFRAFTSLFPNASKDFDVNLPRTILVSIHKMLLPESFNTCFCVWFVSC